jgi:hypothetical protein
MYKVRKVMKRKLLGGWTAPRKALVVLLASGLLLFAVLPVMPADAKSVSQWTLMVYLDGDNNLDYYSALNVKAMMAVGSTAAVNVVVFWDRFDAAAVLYKVMDGELDIIEGFQLSGEEANMGDPDTLHDFVSYTTHQFKANHYALVLWDHGDDHRGCCWDDHPEDHLTHQEISAALSGFSIDILAFDACVQGMIEIAYEYYWIGLDIDYLVATEGYVPYAGYPYDMILSDLVGRPTMSAFDLSKVMVDDYVAFYDALRPASRLVELASVDMSRVDSIVEQLGYVTGVLRDLLMGNDRELVHEMIAEAKGEGNLGWSEYGWEAYVDLPSFVRVLSTYNIPSSAMLYHTLKSAIYVQASEALSSAEGMGIFFPGSHASYENNELWYGGFYLLMQFPHEGWWDFLLAYWSG